MLCLSPKQLVWSLMGLSFYSLAGGRTFSPPPLFVRHRPIAISKHLFNSFTILLSCVDATTFVLVMSSGGKGWFSMSQYIQHMVVTVVYESGFTVNLNLLLTLCLIFTVNLFGKSICFDLCYF